MPPSSHTVCKHGFESPSTTGQRNTVNTQLTYDANSPYDNLNNSVVHTGSMVSDISNYSHHNQTLIMPPLNCVNGNYLTNNHNMYPNNCLDVDTTSYYFYNFENRYSCESSKDSFTSPRDAVTTGQPTLHTLTYTNSDIYTIKDHSGVCHSSSFSKTPASSIERIQKIRHKRRHVPHYKRPRVYVDRRNSRERKRVEIINDAFQHLRQHLPGLRLDEQASKMSILRHASQYIVDLWIQSRL